MNKLLLLVASLCLATTVSVRAQNTYPWPASGNVGIGTTAPNQQLSINGNLSVGSTGSFIMMGQNAYTGGGGYIFLKSTGDYGRDFNILNYSNAAGWRTNLFVSGDTGNVGIGTVAPEAKLHVQNAASINLLVDGLRVSRPNSANCYGFLSYGGGASGEPGNTAYFGSVYAGGSKGRIAFRVSDGTANIDAAVIDPLGNFGIGTASPGTKLDVNGTVAIGKNYKNVLLVGPLDRAPGYIYINTKIPFTDNPAPQLHVTGYNYSAQNKAVSLTLSWYVYQNAFYWAQYKSDIGYYNPSRIRLGTYDDNGTIRIRIEIANDGTYWSSYSISATDHNGVAVNYSGWSYFEGELPAATGNILAVSENSGFVFKSNGNVGIGTTNPTEKLSVKGRIRAQEVVVDNNNWSDYVLAKNYKLTPLSEVEQHIEKEGHLPGVPSAQEVAEKGVSVGDMQAVLLAKIEELTLHQIAQEKAISALQNIVQTIKTENAQLKAGSK